MLQRKSLDRFVIGMRFDITAEIQRVPAKPRSAAYKAVGIAGKVNVPLGNKKRVNAVFERYRGYASVSRDDGTVRENGAGTL
jgi:hypothetical protein